MKHRNRLATGVLIFCALAPVWVFGQSANSDDNSFKYENVFDIETATAPGVSPDGKKILYLRNFMDKVNDRSRSNLWVVNADGSGDRPLTSGLNNISAPMWSPSGDRVMYVASADDDSRQFFVYWFDTNNSRQITHLTNSPQGAVWSPDGSKIAFTSFVAEKSASTISLPFKPQGSKWADSEKVFDTIQYQQDGAGYSRVGNSQIFIMKADGSDVFQVTKGSYSYSGLQWSNDGRYLYASSNQREDREYFGSDSEIFRINVETGNAEALTDRFGPDRGAVLSPDGSKIAYLGYDETYAMYQMSKIYVMNADGSGNREVKINLDADLGNLNWSADSKGLYFGYTDKAVGKIAYTTLDGAMTVLVEDVNAGGNGRPYSGGSYSVNKGLIAYTFSTPHIPTNLAVVQHTLKGKTPAPKVITQLNSELVRRIKLGEVKEIWYKSSHDGWDIQGWYITPPDFNPNKKYPLLLEIHGGPLLSYGPSFSDELQLYAAAGYVVLYTNPRGSTSYGYNFAASIDRDYPHYDYDDLMSGVDAMIEKGFIDNDRLYVTGGSGGGALTAWIVGQTNRFRAAVVQKPVVNWYDWSLTADMGYTGLKYWTAGEPWNHLQEVMERSPISYVGNVTTPTMVLTGENDLRTPVNQSQQYYFALKVRKIPTRLVLISGAGHGIGNRPSNAIRQVAHVLKWFDEYK